MPTPEGASIAIRSAGRTDPGLVRSENQDSIFVDDELGLYMVLDGMGGHQGGGTASRIGCEVIMQVVEDGIHEKPAAQLIIEAIQRAGAQVFREANRRRELHGMGTTAVALMMPSPTDAIVAHVGDSRAYLMRHQRLQRLTADHTVVAELVASGKITPEQAIGHPHSSVLSRNLGGLMSTEVEAIQIELQEGDRLLLCSDGLNGFASQGAIETVLSGADSPERATRDLIELAKRGGGGDNVSVIVVEVGEPRRAASVIPDTGASAWWKRRTIFLHTCERMGLHHSALAGSLSRSEALEFLGASFFEAVYHDLENTTGVHVWTYADSLVRAWFERDGRYKPVQELFDVLRAASMAIVKDISAADENFGVCLEIALLRALIVGEMVVGGQLGDAIEDYAEIDDDEGSSSFELPENTFSSLATAPFQSLDKPLPTGPEVRECLERALDDIRLEVGAARDPQLAEILDATHQCARDFSGDGIMVTAARDLHGGHLLSEMQLTAILDKLDRCRHGHLRAIGQQNFEADVRTDAYRATAIAYQNLLSAFAIAVIDAGKPTTDRLREMSETTQHMRERLARNEKHLARLAPDLDTLDEGKR